LTKQIVFDEMSQFGASLSVQQISVTVKFY